MVEVVGSIPIAPTSEHKGLPVTAAPFYLVRQAWREAPRLALSRPAVVAARDDLEVKVLYRPGKGNG